MDFRNQCQNILLNDILQIAPYIHKGPISDPHTIIRSARAAIAVVMKAYLLSEMCYGHTLYHESNIIENECVYVTVMHNLYHNILGLPIGTKVYHFRKILTVVVTGDGGRLPKVPLGTPMVPLAFVRVLGLKDYAHHSRHSGLPILISKLGDHHGPILNNYSFPADCGTNRCLQHPSLNSSSLAAAA